MGAVATPGSYTQTLSIHTASTAESMVSRRRGKDIIPEVAPITIVASTSQLPVVNPSLPVENVRDCIARAKSQPGKLNCGSSGPGGPLHLAMERLKSMTGVNPVHVACNGGLLAERCVERAACRDVLQRSDCAFWA